MKIKTFKIYYPYSTCFARFSCIWLIRTRPSITLTVMSVRLYNQLIAVHLNGSSYTYICNMCNVANKVCAHDMPLCILYYGTVCDAHSLPQVCMSKLHARVYAHTELWISYMLNMQAHHVHTWVCEVSTVMYCMAGKQTRINMLST